MGDSYRIYNLAAIYIYAGTRGKVRVGPFGMLFHRAMKAFSCTMSPD